MPRFTVLLTPDVESGGYTVTVPALPGCVADGETIDSALDRGAEAISLYLRDRVGGTLTPQRRVEVIAAGIEVEMAGAEVFQDTNERLDFKQFLLSAPSLDVLNLERDQSPPREVNLT